MNPYKINSKTRPTFFTPISFNLSRLLHKIQNTINKELLRIFIKMMAQFFSRLIQSPHNFR